MGEIQKYVKIDTSKILTNIINSGKLGNNFVPEVDGKEMLIDLLPIEEARAAGKNSEFYQDVSAAYSMLMSNIRMILNGKKSGTTYNRSRETVNENGYDTRNTTVHRREGPYRGVYGHWK